MDAAPEAGPELLDAESLAANELASEFFQDALHAGEGAAARRYAASRGLTVSDCREWEIGYAPPGWEGLTNALGARGYDHETAIAAGLAVQGARGVYDRFRERLVFPIRDEHERLVGFGARALEEEQEPKYLNTPQTALFDKSAICYGFPRARREMERSGSAIVVEGYLDVIGCWQAGVENAVAVLGTAVSGAQVAAIARLCSSVVLALDADNAGAEAVWRALDVMAREGESEIAPAIDWRGIVSYQEVLRGEVLVAALPRDSDPADLARSAPAELRACITAASPALEYLFDATTQRTDFDNPRARAGAVAMLAPLVAAVADPLQRGRWAQRLARIGGVDVGTIQRIMQSAATEQRAPRARRGAVSSDPASRGGPASGGHAATAERQLMGLLLRHEQVADIGQGLEAEVIESEEVRAEFSAWLAGEDCSPRLAELPEVLMHDTLPDEELRRLVTDLVDGLRAQRQHRRLRAETRAIARAAGEARQAGATGEQALLAERLGELAEQRRGAPSG